MSKPAPNLSWLASRNGPVTDAQIAQIQRWLDADWESHDIDRNAVKLISRLVSALGVAREQCAAAINARKGK
jgi:hypothetical protein